MPTTRSARPVCRPRAPGGHRGRELHARHARSARRRLRTWRGGEAAIVYCSMSGSAPISVDGLRQGDGQHHPGAQRTHDDLGRPADRPSASAFPSPTCARRSSPSIGILAALPQRDATGPGQHVDVSMLGALTSLVAAEPFDLLEAAGPAAHGRMVPRLTPFGVFESPTAISPSARRPTSSRAASSWRLAGPSSSAIRACDARCPSRERGRINALHRDLHARHRPPSSCRCSSVTACPPPRSAPARCRARSARARARRDRPARASDVRPSRT